MINIKIILIIKNTMLTAEEIALSLATKNGKATVIKLSTRPDPNTRVR